MSQSRAQEHVTRCTRGGADSVGVIHIEVEGEFDPADLEGFGYCCWRDFCARRVGGGSHGPGLLTQLTASEDSGG